MIDRRLLLALGGGAVLLPASAQAAAPARAVELTLLRASGSGPEPLASFIEANWFAMDRIAVAQGLMTHFALWIETSPREWSHAVVVGYPDPRGYDGIRDAFEAIRKEHAPELIDGRGLKELGTIVGSHRLLIRG